jgi:hypothetical protein
LPGPRAPSRNSGSSTDTIRASGGGRVAIPGRPLQAIISVVDTLGNPVAWQERPNGAIIVGSASNSKSTLVDITYRSGWDTLSDEILDVVCTIAARLEALNPALASGAQTESGGDESITFGWDAHQGVGDLVASEKARLSRIFPRVRRVIVAG